MDLNEVILEHELTVDSADTGLQTENSLVGWHTKVNDSIVEADVLSDDGHLTVLGFLITTTLSALGLLVEHLSRGILNLEGQVGYRFVNTPDLLDLELNLLSAALDGLVGDGDRCHDFDDRLLGDLASVSDHTLTDSLTSKQNALHSCDSLSTHDKGHFALTTRVVHTASDSNILILLRGVEVFDINVCLLEANLRVTLRSVQGQIAEFVRTRVIWIFDELILLGLFLLSLSETLSFGSLFSILFLVFLSLVLSTSFFRSCIASSCGSWLGILASFLSLFDKIKSLERVERNLPQREQPRLVHLRST